VYLQALTFAIAREDVGFQLLDLRNLERID
jgi:hypothetical protein